ncbi:hypothetical protein, partial [Rhizobium laguerreae]|uniref:hypothetical protein n=1 Tax=Rhizobium laguerreae TaxID=1076926 RepID=UPI0019814C66
SVKRLRFILWSSQMGQSLLQNGLFQRGKVMVIQTRRQVGGLPPHSTKKPARRCRRAHIRFEAEP